jgi:hypothetical protein
MGRSHGVVRLLQKESAIKKQDRSTPIAESAEQPTEAAICFQSARHQPDFPPEPPLVKETSAVDHSSLADDDVIQEIDLKNLRCGHNALGEL